MHRKFIALFLFFLGGFAALAWQVLWHINLSLAIGVSAKGTALTLATVMGGLALGALWCGEKLEKRPPQNAWLLYGILEAACGLLAWLPKWLLPLIEKGDASVYQSAPFLATPLTALMLALALGPAVLAMGATFPVIGLLAKENGAPLSLYYAANTCGAAIGTLAVAFLLLPALGRNGSGSILTLTQFCVLLLAFVASKSIRNTPVKAGNDKFDTPATPAISPRAAIGLAAATGTVTFALEIAWFRLLRSAWLSTTDSFAIMLFVFLLSLSLGAFLSKKARHSFFTIGVIVAFAAIAIWIGTPAIERLDLFGTAAGSYLGRVFVRVLAAFVTMGPAVVLLGISLPWLLDEARTPRAWAQIYGVNTIGAVVGSLLTGWFLLSWIGPVMASWTAAAGLAVAALVFVRTNRVRFEFSIAFILVALFSWWLQSGVGTERAQGPTKLVREEHKLIANINGPDVTTSVVETGEGAKILFIDGYASTGEFGSMTNYMDAMGRLPMLLHNDPKSALVICFGTGQTARAVLDEQPDRLDIVDVNPAVFELAEHFESNREVLQDKRVRQYEMDGRAWLRRSGEKYDVVTLEPMPPFFAGSNSLYSVEFYDLVKDGLHEDGFVAQWFPTHLMTPEHARAVAAAFVEAFPKSLLWFDPNNKGADGVPQQGILIGRKGDREWDRWPGFSRYPDLARPLDMDTANQNIALSTEQLPGYIGDSPPVTDNNQILSYGKESLQRLDLSKRFLARENIDEIRKAVE